MSLTLGIYLPWMVWAVTWIAAALWANRTLKRPGLDKEWGYRALTLMGFALLLGGAVSHRDGQFDMMPFPGALGMRIWIPPLDVRWAMVGVSTIGFLFAWWARIHLGRLWSGRITRKEGHKVIDTGPYALVRHPIYTGIIGAGVATAIAMGTVHAYLGALFLLIGYWMKARIEERFLRTELGADAYDAYAQKTPMLIPLSHF